EAIVLAPGLIDDLSQSPQPAVPHSILSEVCQAHLDGLGGVRAPALVLSRSQGNETPAEIVEEVAEQRSLPQLEVPQSQCQPSLGAPEDHRSKGRVNGARLPADGHVIHLS